MKIKQCNTCTLLKSVNLFTRVLYKNGSIGYSSDCKECKRNKMRLYRKTDVSKKQRKEHYIKNRKRLIEISLKFKKRPDYRFYSIFMAIKRRCCNPKSDNYKYYGGRGIKVLWNTYEDFKKDMYKSYLKHELKYGTKNTTIDRIDVNDNYCKSNCRWATWGEQQSNKRITSF